MTDINATIARSNAILDAMKTALQPVLRDHAHLTEMNDAADLFKSNAGNTRLDVLRNLALFSNANALTDKEIETASDNVVRTLVNDKLPKSIATFIGDVKCAMNPKVRVVYERLVVAIDAAWDREQADKLLNENATAPIKKAFARKYHFLKQAMLEVKDNGNVMLESDVLRNWAISRDPDHDIAKVMVRMKKIFADLAAFKADFPVTAIGDMLNVSQFITENTLAHARAELLGVDVDIVKGTKVKQNTIQAAPLPAIVPMTVADALSATPPAPTVPVAAPQQNLDVSTKKATFATKPKKAATSLKDIKAVVNGSATDATDLQHLAA